MTRKNREPYQSGNSYLYTGSVALGIYIGTILVLFLIRAENALLAGLAPAFVYILATTSRPFLRQVWHQQLTENTMKDIILLGKQGSGKGTQGRILSDKHGYKIFETGSELRAIAATETELGKEVKAITERGDLVSNEVVMKIVANFISTLDEGTPVIFDGIPRSQVQRESLEQELEKANRNWQALLIELSDTEAKKRLLNRGTANDTGKAFGVESTAPVRADDNEAGILRRLANFAEHTEPLIRTWAEADKLLTVNGEQDPVAVTAAINDVLGLS